MVMDYEEIKERLLRMNLEDRKRVAEETLTEPGLPWTSGFSEREIRLIQNCKSYTGGDPAGLPGHNLMIIIERMAALLDAAHERRFRV